MACTNTNTQNNTKDVEHPDATDICVFRIFFNDFSKKCCVTALVRSMAFIGGLNQI